MRRLLLTALLLIIPAAPLWAATIEGTVTGNRHSCVVDGICSFGVTAEDGTNVSVIYNQEAPVGGCRFTRELSDAVWKLTQGDKIKADIPDHFKGTPYKDGTQVYYLCEGSTIYQPKSTR